ncbi:hypothetical protein BJX76DRAFT_360843 [Aspergillus varians]
MRVPIAVQLSLLVLLTTLTGLAALAIATWINKYNFVAAVKSHSLDLITTFESSQIVGSLDLLEFTCKTIVTRLLLQSALQRYYAGEYERRELGVASIYARGIEDAEGSSRRLLNVTSDGVPDIRLPYAHVNGTPVMFGDEELGYPPSLYPNLTQGADTSEVYAFGDVPVTMDRPLLLGPLATSASLSLIALTNGTEKDGVFSRLRRNRSPSGTTQLHDQEPYQFQLPSRVKERKHLVTDEITELTSTFNEMSDELVIQTNRLEVRFAERTRELEITTVEAETANESKTLFIANISHELKTPLNGIFGMCAVCLGEDDLPRIQKSLHTIYNRNRSDQAIPLEEKEFKLWDLRSQLATIFQKQILEKQISFSIMFCDPETPRISEAEATAPRAAGPVFGPPGTGRLKDMVLGGDQHRILQILINLVGNSLKFTPEEDTIAIRIKCMGEERASPPTSESRSPSPGPIQASSHASWRRDTLTDRIGDGADESPTPPRNMRTVFLQFEVEDTGPGIPQDLQNRVFEPFIQGDLRLNRKYGGTGLGLSICRQLARLMHGQILLESEQARGTLFSVRIPLGFVRESAPSTASSSIAGSRASSVFSLNELAIVARLPSSHSVASQYGSKSGSETQDSRLRLLGLGQPFFVPPVHPVTDERKTRALVAEDNVINQEVVLKMLALEDIYDVTAVKDGQEAYDTVKANMEDGKMFDLILMDVQMPNLDGIQSTRLIRKIGYSAPIVALTALSEDSNIKDCMNSGMDMFISKPIRRLALKQVLQKFTTIPEEPEKHT